MTDAPLEPIPEDRERAPAIVAHPDDMEYYASGAVVGRPAGGSACPARSPSS